MTKSSSWSRNYAESHITKYVRVCVTHLSARSNTSYLSNAIGRPSPSKSYYLLSLSSERKNEKQFRLCGIREPRTAASGGVHGLIHTLKGSEPRCKGSPGEHAHSPIECRIDPTRGELSGPDERGNAVTRERSQSFGF